MRRLCVGVLSRKQDRVITKYDVLKKIDCKDYTSEQLLNMLKTLTPAIFPNRRMSANALRLLTGNARALPLRKEVLKSESREKVLLNA